MTCKFDIETEDFGVTKNLNFRTISRIFLGYKVTKTNTFSMSKRD